MSRTWRNLAGLSDEEANAIESDLTRGVEGIYRLGYELQGAVAACKSQALYKDNPAAQAIAALLEPMVKRCQDALQHLDNARIVSTEEDAKQGIDIVAAFKDECLASLY